jgi:hypothetical protein
MNFVSGKECIRAIRNLPSKPESLPQLQQIWAYVNHKKFKLDAVDYTQLLKQCYSPKRSNLGHSIIQHIQTNLPQQKIDSILLTSMVNMLIKCGDPAVAITLWNENLPADRVMYMCFLMACTDANRYFHLYQHDFHFTLSFYHFHLFITL